MPTYEYQCDACGHNFDEFQYFSEPALTKCPKCKKKKLHRVFGTGAAIIFKGSGFYETDYRSESYKAGQKKEEEAAKPAEAKSDAKPEAKGTPAAGTNGESKGSGGGKKGKAGSTGKGAKKD
jgi:putative FmdB family regulatory protein